MTAKILNQYISINYREHMQKKLIQRQFYFIKYSLYYCKKIFTLHSKSKLI